jgi:hypothetical protein
MREPAPQPAGRSRIAAPKELPMADKKKKKKHQPDDAAPLTRDQYRAEILRVLNAIAHYLSVLADDNRAATKARPAKRKA